MSDQNPNDGIGPDRVRTEVAVLKATLEERTTQRDTYRASLRLEERRVQRIRETLGGDKDLDTEHLAKAVVQELAEARAQREGYKAALGMLNIEMEVLRGDNEILATRLQDTKELLDDAEKRPWWGDRPDEVEIVGKVLRLCGVYDDVSDEGFNRAGLLVKGYFAAQYPLHMRPDFPLKDGWNAG